MLRRATIVVSAVVLIAAIALLASGAGGLAVALGWMGVQAAIVLIALLAERGRYHPRVGGGRWVRTAERFQDPTSHRWVVVEFNPATGERRYVSPQEDTEHRSQNTEGG
jgi:hypothetical protein